jgi:hypothetical protein
MTKSVGFLSIPPPNGKSQIFPSHNLLHLSGQELGSFALSVWSALFNFGHFGLEELSCTWHDELWPRVWVSWVFLFPIASRKFLLAITCFALVDKDWEVSQLACEQHCSSVISGSKNLVTPSHDELCGQGLESFKFSVSAALFGIPSRVCL